MFYRVIAPILVLSMLSVCHAAGFSDPYFFNGAARSDFFLTPEQTLTFDTPQAQSFLFGEDCQAQDSGTIEPGSMRCLTGESISYPTSNYFSFGDTSRSYWVVNANTEPAFDQPMTAPSFVTGPPGASQPISTYGNSDSVYTVVSYPNANGIGNEMSIMINAHKNNFGDQQPIPYLEIAAHNGHGNQGPPARLGQRDILRFNARLRENIGEIKDTGDGITPRFFALVAMTWDTTDGVPVMVQLLVLHEDHRPSSLPPGGVWGSWSWPIHESVYYPGARYQFFKIGEAADCGAAPVRWANSRMRGNFNSSFGHAADTPQHYEIDLERLFRCPANRWADKVTPNARIDHIGWSLEVQKFSDRQDVLHVGISNPTISVL